MINLAMKLGIERLLETPKLLSELSGRRVALVGHPASTNKNLEHSLDLLFACPQIQLTSAFGPQHGMKGDKQYNMLESDDEVDAKYKIPIFSLYGKVRRPTAEMLDTFDVCLVDLQDVGCRIYTYLTTLIYLMEDCAKAGKELWVLDRPNPGGRAVEGRRLDAGFKSFVGAADLCLRHGLTLGEVARWYATTKKLDLKYTVVKMESYSPTQPPYFGWPDLEMCWVNPSPNLANPWAAKMYGGTVILEGVNLSEGRGTTRPLELLGAPKMKSEEILKDFMEHFSSYQKGCLLRSFSFEPTFDKFKGELCSGIQIHIDRKDVFQNDKEFQPLRLVTALLKSVRRVQPELLKWRDPPYEYEYEKLPFDLVTGDTSLREWVDNPSSTQQDLENLLLPHEKSWTEERKPFLLYT